MSKDRPEVTWLDELFSRNRELTVKIHAMIAENEQLIPENEAMLARNQELRTQLQKQKRKRRQ